MLKKNESALVCVDALIKQHHLLNHEFYKAWSKGKLTKECLIDYAKEYYHHVKAFPTYLSAIHSRSDCQKTRQILLSNLIEEEAGSPNHPDLWKSFALSLGATEEEINNHKPSREIKEVIDTFRTISREGTVPQGIAALYAYESQIPEICISKIEGLKKFYGMKNPKDWEYFRVHISADKEHAAQEQELLRNSINSRNQRKVMEATSAVLKALNEFLSMLCVRHQISCA